MIFSTTIVAVLDAHNCYPYQGRWADRIERALQTGFPVAIEQDITLYGGQPVVSHSDKPTGAEPTLREHFFERVRPLMESALAANDRARWPLIVVHFDFKSVQPELLRGVWKLLGEYEPWLTTAPKTADPRQLAAFDPKPLLVLTEDADEQEEVFFRALPVGAKLRVFGSAHKHAFHAGSQQESWHLQATAAPQELLPDPPTNYRRWWNNSWYAVEEGGQRRAGEWTAADDRRLRALVDHAHKLGSKAVLAAVLRGQCGASLSYSWAVIPGDESNTGLPAGLTFTSAGLLSGTPQETGYFSSAGRITDAFGNSRTFM